MNENDLKFICTKLQLGSPAGVVTRVYGSRGGSFMWRVNTGKGSYAIKQLATAIDLESEKLVTKYELSETIAYRFSQQGIPAVSALEKSGKHLVIIDNMGYLVYPWVEGYTLGRNEVSETHAIKIAETIAKLHDINMYVPEIKAPHVDTHTNGSIVEAIDKTASFQCPFSKRLKENQRLILSMNDQYLAIAPLLLEDTIVTHGDLDQLNALWNKANRPILIDWESVRKMNRTREIVRASLNWSGLGSEDFSLPIYDHMLRTYRKSGGMLNVHHINAALYSLVGSMVNWLLYNIKLACINDISSAQDITIDEINWALMTMMRFKAKFHDLLKISAENAKDT